MLYIPEYFVTGLTVSVAAGYITVSAYAERLFSVPCYGKVADKLFVSGKAVPMTQYGAVKRGLIVV